MVTTTTRQIYPREIHSADCRVGCVGPMAPLGDGENVRPPHAFGPRLCSQKGIDIPTTLSLPPPSIYFT